MTLKPFLITAFLAAACCGVAQAITFDQALGLARTNRSLLKAAGLARTQAASEAAAIGSPSPLALALGASLPKGFGPTDQDLSLHQGLDLFGRRAGLRALGTARQLEAQAEEVKAILSVQSEATAAFIEACASRDSLAVARELRLLAQELQTAAIRRYEEGRVPEVQADRAKIEVKRGQAAEAALSSQYEAGLKRLAAAIGSSGVAGVAGEVVLDVPVSLTQRPDLLVLAARIRSAEAEGGIARSSLNPETALSLHRSPWEEESRFGLRLQFTWNLLDGGRAKSEWSASKARRASFEAAYQDALAQAEAEDTSLQIEIKAGEEELKALAGLGSDLRSLADKTRRGFQEGVGTMVEVLEAVRALREVEMELISAKKRVSLLKALRVQNGGALLEAMK